MEFFKKIVNKIQTFLTNIFKPQKLLNVPSSEQIDSSSKEETLVDSSNNSIINNITQPQEELSPREKAKKEFLQIYQAYKDGNVKKEHLLITDLINIQILMLDEINALNQKIILQKQENGIKENELKQLLYKKSLLEEKFKSLNH